MGAEISDDLLAAAAASEVDPFLLAALALFQSACNPALTSPSGTGLLRIDRDMYLIPGAPKPPVEKAELSERNLLDPKQNLSVGARLLKMWQDAHAELDEQFPSVPHRSAVAHFVWGDDVRSSGQEDLILTARRRMILSYNGTPDDTRETSLGIRIVSPLEGTPRVATSGPGEDREGGARQHRGLDITATIGEPVRAIADGVVVYAGASLGKHRPRPESIPPTRSGATPTARWAWAASTCASSTTATARSFPATCISRPIASPTAIASPRARRSGTSGAPGSRSLRPIFTWRSASTIAA